MMMSFASRPAGRFRTVLLALVLLAGAAGRAHAAGDTFEAYQAALSYRDAVHGSADAQADLAARYAEGRGLPQSNEKAVHWLTRAAEQGHVGATLRLSECYAAGRGTERNDVTAYKWAFLAAVHSASGADHDHAMAMLDTLIHRMSEQQLAEARRLVDEPQPEPAATRSARPSDDNGEEPASGHRVSKLHRAGRADRSTRHDGRARRFHFARPWWY